MEDRLTFSVMYPSGLPKVPFTEAEKCGVDLRPGHKLDMYYSTTCVCGMTNMTVVADRFCRAWLMYMTPV